MAATLPAPYVSALDLCPEIITFSEENKGSIQINKQQCMLVIQKI
jgi:hypothetical protein